ncbi:MAG: large conductance mechanosensitive channel protein MscL [Chloroflexi bacterium]|nr:MAG: large conductance mechanosensitive channel protein MscL [Chloroflexota bacterium]
MLREFREFINRGNVMDLAVAVIIGVAFGAIVTSLVDDIIMPVIGVIIGGIDFTGLAVTVGNATITYGNFIQAVINFLIIAFVIFLMVRTINNMQKRFAQEAKATPPPEAPADVQLLAEIRDLLKANLQDGRATAGIRVFTPEE